MLLLRIGRKGRWEKSIQGTSTTKSRTESRTATDPLDVQEAEKDLTLDKYDEGLSVYRVSDESEAKLIACKWAIEFRTRDDNADYIIFDECEIVASHRLEQKDDLNTDDPQLRSLHHELIETSEQASRKLAERLLSPGKCQVRRVPRADVASARAARNSAISLPARSGE